MEDTQAVEGIQQAQELQVQNNSLLAYNPYCRLLPQLMHRQLELLLSNDCRKEKSGVEIECFIHGARCISLSGRCFMSQELFNKSANRGECIQPCRREYKVTDEEGKEMIMENNFIMSAKDLCALPLLPKLIEAISFKDFINTQYVVRILP